MRVRPWLKIMNRTVSFSILTYPLDYLRRLNESIYYYSEWVGEINKNMTFEKSVAMKPIA